MGYIDKTGDYKFLLIKKKKRKKAKKILKKFFKNQNFLYSWSDFTKIRAVYYASPKWRFINEK